MVKSEEKYEITEDPFLCPNCGAAEGAEAKVLLITQKRTVHFCDECFTSWEISDDEKKKINIKKDPKVSEWIARFPAPKNLRKDYVLPSKEPREFFAYPRK
jgi:transcription elongation factor Elf1